MGEDVVRRERDALLAVLDVARRLRWSLRTQRDRARLESVVDAADEAVCARTAQDEHDAPPRPAAAREDGG